MYGRPAKSYQFLNDHLPDSARPFMSRRILAVAIGFAEARSPQERGGTDVAEADTA